MKIYLQTPINATPEVCFNLSRDIDLHVRSMQLNGERVVAGVTAGLIGLDETVTWEAWHVGFKTQRSVRVTAFKYAELFTVEQVKGWFKYIHHVHRFLPTARGTLMVDDFEFASPLGILGQLADWLAIKRYITNLLKHRNHIIKMAAEQCAV